MVRKALDTTSPDHIQWLKALLEMQKVAHDPAVFTHRTSPRSKAIKPHLSVLVDFYLLLILWGTRARETRLLEWAQVDLTKRLIWLAEDTTKNAALDVMPLTPWAAEILQERKRLNELWRPDAPGRYVFQSRGHGHPINSPRGVLVALAEQTGIGLTAHDLRRSLAREIGSDDDLLHTARLLVSGAALHHGAGKGGSRVAGATHRYLEEKANILRPLYQKRENRLRELVGLQGEKPKAELDVDAVLDRMRADPEFFQQVMQTALRPKS
ncbi:tyrosine-type recombinase/integrase [Dyella sp.]|uniref:tyrosine-type recombinase/integrase n=1 Tax=Dyella sp. TaxID=1869338 RepID=UPI002ECFF64D